MRLTVDIGVPVPMRDGCKLVADVHRAEQREPLPALVQRVPYGRETGRVADFALDLRRAVAAGYAVIVQDVRGRFASGGTFTPFLDDGRDGADTIEWAARQPWCDGRVAMIGGSYAGAAQWAAARERPEALRAIAPFVATADCYDDWIYRDGVFELGFNLLWALRPIGLAAAAQAPPERRAALIAGNDALRDLYRRLPLADQPALAGLAPFYADWLAEPTAAGGWSRLALGRSQHVTVPVLSVGGWYDVFQRGTLAGHASVTSRGDGTAHRLVMGPWAHGVFGGEFAERSFGIGADAAAVDLTALQLRWLDRWVRGVENGAERDAPVRLFVMGADYWRDEVAWPPPDATGEDHFLHGRGRANSLEGDGRLTTDAPGDEPEDSYVYDPRSPVPTIGGATFLPGLAVAANAGPRDQRPVELRDDVLCYTGAPLEQPLEVTGPVRLVLFASSSAPDTDFTAKLVDVHPDGRAIGIADGILRARYRESRAEPSLIRPDQAYELAVDLGATAHVFRPGHRIRLEVSSGSFPRFDRNPQTGEPAAEAAEVRPAVNRVYHDAARPSRLVLPRVHRAETAERMREATAAVDAARGRRRHSSP